MLVHKCTNADQIPTRMVQCRRCTQHEFNLMRKTRYALLQRQAVGLRPLPSMSKAVCGDVAGTQLGN
jgi:hypothetical protein